MIHWVSYTPEANTEYTGGPGSLGTGSSGPAGNFSGNRNSGKSLLLLRQRFNIRDVVTKNNMFGLKD